MSEILTAIVGYPGFVATVLLGVVMAYWLFVMVGALDIDLFSGDGAVDGAVGGHLDGAVDGAVGGHLDGAVDGAVGGHLDGAVDGAVGGHVDGAVDGAVGGHVDGAVDGAVEGASKGAAEAAADSVVGASKAVAAAKSIGHGAAEAADMMSIANFRSVPITVMLSALVCFGWFFCVVGTRSARAVEASLPLPWWLIGSLILVLSFLLALVPTAIAIRPMSRFFVTHPAKRNTELVGKVCVVTTGRVDAKFGQAALESESMSLLIQVRMDRTTELKKGSKALIVSWDGQRGAFLVEPYDDVVNGS